MRRYEVQSGREMHPHSDGEWVRWEDALKELRAARAAGVNQGYRKGMQELADKVMVAIKDHR